MKKILAAIMALCFVGGSMPAVYNSAPECAVTAFAETDYQGNEYEFVTEGSLTYRVYADHAELIKCDTDAEGEVIIPKKINGVPVTSIFTYAFWACENLTSITIPDSVIRIRQYSFVDLPNVKTINIPDSIETIEANAFAGCEWQEAQKLKNNGFFIAGGFLLEAQDVSGEVVIPDGVKTIAYNAFSGNSEITSVTIPDSVKRIDNWAFLDCTSLENVTIGKSLETIGKDVFKNVPWFEKKISENELFIVNNMLLSGVNCREKDLVIPDDITFIATNAFRDNTILESITIPDSVKSIGYDVFNGCNSLKRAKLPAELDHINHGMFCNCKSLEEVNIPETVDMIGNGAFCNCEKLKEIIIPEGVKAIYDEALVGIGVSELVIPASVETIAAYPGYDYLGNMGMQQFATIQGDNVKSITFLNPDCFIPNSLSMICNGYYENGYPFLSGVIYGYEGSTAQAYAEKYGYKFEALPDKTLKKGDANGDGDINMSDVVIVMQASLNPKKYGVEGTSEDRITAEGEKAGDVDGKEGLSANDALIIQRYSLKLIDTL